MGDFEIKDLDLNEPGLYKFTFNVFSVCEDPLCIDGDDSIQITINQDSKTLFTFPITYTSTNSSLIKWEKMSFELNLDDPIIDVIYIIFFVSDILKQINF